MLSKTDEKLLQDYFAAGSEDLPSYQQVSGFLFGLGMTPDEVLPDEWLEYVLKRDEESVGESLKIITGGLARVYNVYVNAFHQKRLEFPFQLAEMLSSNAEMVSLIDWITGFVDALYMRAEFWDGNEFSEFSHEKQQMLYHSVLMLEGIVEPEIVFEVFEKLPDEVLRQAYPTLNLEGDNVPQQIIMICLMSSQDAVETLQSHAREILLLRERAREKKAGGAEVIQVDFEKKRRK